MRSQYMDGFPPVSKPKETIGRATSPDLAYDFADG
jgi:hypothetical protein